MKYSAKPIGVTFLLSVLLFLSALPVFSAQVPTPSLSQEISSYRKTHALPAYTSEPRLTLAARKVADKLARLGPKSVPADFLKMALTNENYIANNAKAFVSFVPDKAEYLLDGFIAKPQIKAALLDAKKWAIGTAIIPNPSHRAYKGTAYILVMILAQPSQPARANWQKATLDLVNKFRAENRLPALRLNKKLSSAAQAHADDMFTRDFFDHTSPSGTNAGQRAGREGYKWRTILENLATGQTTPFETVEGWKNSTAGHREAMLNPTITEAGIGYRFMANDKGRYTGQHYWAMTMAQPK